MNRNRSIWNPAHVIVIFKYEWELRSVGQNKADVKHLEHKRKVTLSQYKKQAHSWRGHSWIILERDKEKI